jgi:Zn2+/Cd2+-exporting ATPase
LPADKKTGDEVFAGTQNLTGVLEIKVSRAGEDTTLGRVRELIHRRRKNQAAHPENRGPIHGLLHAARAGHRRARLGVHARFDRVIAVFVVSCPCAFILATPTAMVAALSAAARLGILIKNVADIELRRENQRLHL